MRKILSDTQATSDTWIGSGKDGTIMLTGHNGGTWTLQAQAPNGVWIDTDVTFDDTGIKAAFVMTAAIKYRLTGGSAGAEAWVEGALVEPSIL